MIRINLLPQQLRRKKSVKVSKKTPLLPVVFIITLIILALHVIFALISFDKKMQLASLDQRWDKIQAQSKEVDTLKSNLEIKKEKLKAMQSILKRDLYLTDFLNKINQAIPSRLWLNRLSFSERGLVIEGSVFSFGSEELSLVNNFFNELKNDVFFKQNFDNFNLDSVQRRNIKKYEILDFLLTAEINKESSKIESSNKRER